jgi:hypothetical protein
MNVWHTNSDVLMRAWTCVLPRLMDNESSVADAALDICADVIKFILPPLVKTDPTSSAVAWQQLCAVGPQQQNQLSHAVAVLCKKGTLTRAALAPTLLRILQHEAGVTPHPLLVVALELVKAFPLQDGDILLPQLVSRALALSFDDRGSTCEVDKTEVDGAVAVSDAAREEAVLTLQMVALLAVAVPQGTALQLAKALLQVTTHIEIHISWNSTDRKHKPTTILQGLKQGRVVAGCIGAAVALLAALVRASRPCESLDEWAVLLMHSAEVAMTAELKDRPASTSCSSRTSRSILLKALELVGEVALQGLHVPPSICNVVQALTADMPLPSTGVIDVEVRAVAVLALGKIATSDSVLARRWAPAFARSCSTHSCPLVRNNAMLVCIISALVTDTAIFVQALKV